VLPEHFPHVNEPRWPENQSLEYIYGIVKENQSHSAHFLGSYDYNKVETGRTDYQVWLTQLIFVFSISFSTRMTEGISDPGDVIADLLRKSKEW